MSVGERVCAQWMFSADSPDKKNENKNKKMVKNKNKKMVKKNKKLKKR